MKKISCTRHILLLILLTLPRWSFAQQASENPLEMYGGSLLAMAGRDSVVLVTDQRFGRGLSLIRSGYSRPVWNEYFSNSEEATSTATTSVKAPRWIMTATGLPGDIQSLQSDVQATLQRQISQVPLAGCMGTPFSTRAALTLVSHLLYERRCYLVEPLLVGFDENDDNDDGQQEPVLCSLDMLGATSITKNYACAGGAAAGLWGSAAQHWRPNLPTDELVQVALRAFAAGVDRDILSGYGALVHILHANGKWEELQVASRND